MHIFVFFGSQWKPSKEKQLKENFYFLGFKKKKKNYFKTAAFSCANCITKRIWNSSSLTIQVLKRKYYCIKPASTGLINSYTNDEPQTPCFFNDSANDIFSSLGFRIKVKENILKGHFLHLPTRALTTMEHQQPFNLTNPWLTRNTLLLGPHAIRTKKCHKVSLDFFIFFFK